MYEVKRYYNSDIPYPKSIYSLDSHSDIATDWKEIIYEGNFEDYKKIIDNMDDFFGAITSFYECGATVKVQKISEKYAKNIKQKEKKDIYNLMWPDDSIKERYSSDFEFDIEDFGFECFKWDNNYYLCSGISA